MTSAHDLTVGPLATRVTADGSNSIESPPAARESREVEWQMAASDLGSVRRWLNGHAAIDGMSIEPCQPQQIHDVYLDTEDWRIFRAGYALRTRVNQGRNEVTLKSLQSVRRDVADRRELSEPLQSGELDALIRSTGPVATRVHAVAGGHSLRPLFEVRTRRQRFAVRSEAENEELAEIALDESVILRHDGETTASCQRVEVEVLGERRQKPLQKFVELLGADCGLERAPQSKYELGLTSVGLAPATAPQLAPVEVDRSMRASEAALARLRKLFTAWFTHEPGARLGDDPERLHDLRTATRRIDATLGLFADYLPATLVRSRQKVKSLLSVFGVVRDFDVQLEELARFSRQLDESDRGALEPLRRHLESERAKARSHMLRSLDSNSTRKWLDDSMTRLAQPSSSPASRNDALALAVAPGLLDGGFRKLQKAFRRLNKDSSWEDYHATRGRAKKLRYAIESVAPMYGKPAERMLRRIRRLQDELGNQQDAHVIEQRLLNLASAPAIDLPPRTLFLMGRFAQRCSGTGADARRRLGKKWRRVRGRRWKELRSQAHELRDGATPAGADGEREPAVVTAADGEAEAHEASSDAGAANDASAVRSDRG
jgi:triphosphatase